MKKSFYELIISSRRNSVEDLQEILFTFEPLLKKLSKFLHYEEGNTDLIIFFIELLKKMDLEKFNMKNDGAIVKYIHKSLLNKTFELSKKYSKIKFKFVEFDENVLNIDIQLDKCFFEESICFYEYVFKELCGIQRKVIFYKYLKGYSDKEISMKLNISRQAVNKAKNRAFKKIKNDYKKYLNI
ncbi:MULTISPECIES: sigma factor-like helix-turn-helix DNA-binding protein [unclassified Clostridioides]|uniref:sigma factor-like helix-turn-helix DNA-binding protein n=1 Tax=unclassified Clostridioides TaxID=2635829 RepID=UPI001D12580D|nr:sigma-70 family RNA polymerase sigma factor [Clostridioides sp. ES-S-0171-01]MCC0686780.1 sigma-70 family RNA polymerase sigma factor [Clostridioides sp. ES-S-0056-01]MCC0713706.1 sigma-70 family RNA polymerase sigma factor [Clostridioides sp. ES-S-0077-01]UDN55356.1 sigma-70 family RNA polymerase sigma factor [Clostridioides sp. ES-S-0054-01]